MLHRYASQIKCIYKNMNRTKPCCMYINECVHLFSRRLVQPAMNPPSAGHGHIIKLGELRGISNKWPWVDQLSKQPEIAWRIWRIWTLSGFQWPLSVLMPSNWMQLRSVSYALSSSDMKYSCQTLGQAFLQLGEGMTVRHRCHFLHVKRFGVITAAPFRQLQYLTQYGGTFLWRRHPAPSCPLASFLLITTQCATSAQIVCTMSAWTVRPFARTWWKIWNQIPHKITQNNLKLIDIYTYIIIYI